MFTVRVPGMPRAFLPAVQARLMLPLVVRTTKNKRVFVPHKALAHLPRVVSARASEVVAFSVRVPDVERRSCFMAKSAVEKASIKNFRKFSSDMLSF